MGSDDGLVEGLVEGLVDTLDDGDDDAAGGTMTGCRTTIRRSFPVETCSPPALALATKSNVPGPRWATKLGPDPQSMPFKNHVIVAGLFVDAEAVMVWGAIPESGPHESMVISNGASDGELDGDDDGI